MSEVLTQPVPTQGLNTHEEPTAFSDRYSPRMKNVHVYPTKCKKRRGFSQIGASSLPLSGIGMKLVVYVDARGNRHEFALTTTHVYKYDTSNDEWDDVSPTLQLDDGESNWTDDTGANSADTVANPPGDEPVGDAILIDCVANVSDGDFLAFIALGSATDVSQYNTIKLWVYPVSTGLSANSLELVITEENDGTKGGTEVIIAEHDAAPADTWTQLEFTVDLSSIDGAQSIAIYANHDTEFDALDLYIDDFRVGTTFKGEATHLWAHCLATDTTEFSNNGGTALIISNGVNDLQYFEGHDGDVFKILVHDSGISHCKDIAEFWNHLMFWNFNDGSQNVKSVIYAAAGDIDDHTSSNSGANRLTDSIGQILTTRKFGASLVIYSEKSITMGRYYGGITTFSFPTMIHGTGLLVANAVWGFVNVHFLLGTDQRVYAYYGETYLKPVGSPIEDSLFAELNIENKSHIVTGFDIGRHKVHFFIPTSGTYAKSSYCFNYRESALSWERHEFANTVKGFGSVQASFTWYTHLDPLKDLYCDEVDIYCDDGYGQTGYEMASFISADGYVYMLDNVSMSDDGDDIEFELETPDFVINAEEQYGRWVWFSFQAYSAVVNSTAQVLVSGDGGVTWTGLIDSPIELNQRWTTHRLPVDVVSRKIRFKLSQLSDKDIQIRGLFKCYVEPQTGRD